MAHSVVRNLDEHGILSLFIPVPERAESRTEAMNDPELDRQRDLERWRRLEEELGLPPAPMPGEAPAARALVVKPEEPTAEAPATLPFEEPEAVPQRGRRRRPAAREDEAPPPPEPAVAEVSLTITTEEHIVITSQPVESSQGAEERAAEEEKRRPRRRRGRRSGKAAAAPAAESTAEPITDANDDEVSVEPAEPREEEDEGPRRGRGRGRGRGRKPEPVAARTDSDEDEVVSDDDDLEQPERQEDTDEEITDFRNWTVPSWQDLIASLYRPER